MKKIILSLILLMTPMVLFSQGLPHTFQNGEVIDAIKFNENFEYLLKRTAIRKTTVDCSAGETINDALDKYNHIVISGTCNENIELKYEDNPQSVLILEGASEDASIDKVNASDSDNSTISVIGPVNVKIQNLTISGGENGLGIYHSSFVRVDNCIIENNSNHGIKVADSFFKITNSFIQNNSLIDSGHGINAYANSLAVIDNNSIENHTNGSGISVWSGSVTAIRGNTIINAKNNAIQVGGASVAYIGKKPDDDGQSRGNTITGPFEKGVEVRENSHARFMANTITGYKNTGIRVSRNSSAEIGTDWDRDTYTIGQRMDYGNTLNGTALTGQTVDDWQWGIQVSESSTVQLHRNMIENHQRGGVHAQELSVIDLGGGNTVQNNTHTETDGDIRGTGFEIRSGSTLEMWSDAQEREPNTISGNGRTAFRAEGGELHLRGGGIWEDDILTSEINRLVITGHQTGIRAGRGSKVTLERVDVQNNDRRGIRISENSVLNVWSGGATITGNGLNNDGWDGFGPGLDIDRNSTASVDRLVVSGNGRGIYVGRGSSFGGGWKDEDDTTLPTYMIEIKDNKKWGLEVQKNSNVDLKHIEISGNSKEVYNNDDGSTWYEEAIKIRDSSTGNIRDGKINDNRGRALDIRNNSKFSLNDMEIRSNGKGSSGDTYDAIRVQNHSHLDLNRVTVSLNGRSGLDIEDYSMVHINTSTIENNGTIGEWSNGVDVDQYSQISLDNSTLSSALGNGLNLNGNSKGHVRHSTIQSTYSDQWGGNAVDISHGSEISFNHDDRYSPNLITLSAPSFPLKARENGKIHLNTIMSLTSTDNWDPLRLERNSRLYLNNLGDSQALTLGKINAGQNSWIGISGEFKGQLSQVDLHGGAVMEIWKDCEPDDTCTPTQTTIVQLNCHNTTSTDGQAVYRWPVVFLHGNDNATTIDAATDWDTDCLVVQ